MDRNRHIDNNGSNFILRDNLAPLREKFLSYRKRKCERRSFPQLAFHPNLAAVHFDKFPGQAQSEPCTLALLCVVASDLAELLEDRFLVFARDADAGVGDRGNYRTVT